MSDHPTPSPSAPTVVTGANGFVGAHVCRELAARGLAVRALVRRAGAAPEAPGVEEVVGDTTDRSALEAALEGASALVTTVHPLGADDDTQQRVGVEGTAAAGRAAVDAGVGLHVHVSTAAVYDRSPDAGDVDESSPLGGDDAYSRTKAEADAALAALDGTTRVLVRPPAILGAGPSSVWNTRTPQAVAEDPDQREANPDRTFAWVHVDDLARLIADLVDGTLAPAGEVADGPVAGGCTAVNVAGEPATSRDYLGTVTEALGVEPRWTDEPVWTGQLLADRARAWGWSPAVDLGAALEELAAGLDALDGEDR